MAFKKVEVRKKKPGPGWWSEKTRMEVVTAYVVLGKVSLVVATTGVPEDTVRKWKMAPWWKEAEDEVRRSSKLALSGKLQEVVTKTYLQLEDRVANGDYIYDARLHKLVRKPIDAIVANKIIGDMIDRSILLEEKATKEQINEDGIQQRLDKLREEFRSFAKGKLLKDEKDIIDVEPIVLSIDSTGSRLPDRSEPVGVEGKLQDEHPERLNQRPSNDDHLQSVSDTGTAG
jgi:hypothetical protein